MRRKPLRRDIPGYPLGPSVRKTGASQQRNSLVGKKIEIPEGTKFGAWTVLGEAPKRTGHTNTFYFCTCKCGNEAVLAGTYLRARSPKSCKLCDDRSSRSKLAGQASGIAKNQRAFIGKVHSSYMSPLVSKAKERNITVEITQQDLSDQWDIQEGKCALTGWTLTVRQFADGKGEDRGNASVDRIDSLRGYTPDNIQWVHKDVNQAKWDQPEERFFEICQAVVAYKDQTKKLREGRRPWLT